MDLDDTIDAVQRQYPRIWHAAHRRHPPRGLGGDRPSEREHTVLAHLRIAPTPMGELANHLNIAASTLSEVTHALEARGLVHRHRDPADRRRIAVALTEAGHTVVRDTSPLDTDRLREALASLDPTARATVVEGLTLLAEALR
ncbi:MAG: MarR family winged helix-turn-helix transcriptional regulator [Myxococcota bacterium]